MIIIIILLGMLYFLVAGLVYSISQNLNYFWDTDTDMKMGVFWPICGPIIFGIYLFKNYIDKERVNNDSTENNNR